MENDVLKNKIVPWQEKGRWYHGLWDYSTGKFDPTETDSILMDSNIFELTSDGTTKLIYPLPFNNQRYSIVDVKYKPRDSVVVTANANSSIGMIRTTTTGATGRGFARYTGITKGKADIWFFMDIVEV